MSDAAIISVVVCTYNRADWLANLLETMTQQTLDPALYEVIIVDNNSADHTQQVAERFMAGRDNWRYVVEAKQGLSHARNRGWQEALGEYVAYVDDDCKVPEQWLAVAERVIREHHPDAFGGPYYPFYLTEKPAWFKDEYGTSPSAKWPSGPLSREKNLSGGNMFIQKYCLSITGGFSASFGMIGYDVGYGEENAFFHLLRASRSTAVIMFVRELCVYHLVKPTHMKPMWRLRAAFIQGRSAYRIRGMDEVAQSTKILPYFKLLVKTHIGILLAPISRDRQKYPSMNNYVLEVARPRLYRIGYESGTILHRCTQLALPKG
jgi:glucosyl-dolichyl phosphate glucuronosyltransferase